MKRWVPVVLLIGLLAAAAPARAAQQVKISGLEKDGSSLRFNVLTPGGPQLDLDAFRFSVNGLPAPTTQALPGSGDSHPTGAVLVVDTSGSMQGQPIIEARRAVKLFIDTLEPPAKVALVSFSDRVRVRVPFTGDLARISAEADSLEASGETALHDGLLEAFSLIEDRPAEQKNVVVLTDGADTVSDASFAQTVADTRSSKARVFIVGLASPEYSPRSIAKFASVSGGALLETTNSGKLAELFERVARALVSRYEVVVDNPDPAATQVQLEAEIIHPEGTVTGSRTVALGPTTPEQQPRFSIGLPLLIILLFVFWVLAGVAFLVGEAVRERRNSPSPRVAWYVEEIANQNDREALIRAAIIERANELATSIAHRVGFLERLERDIDVAGMRWRPGEIVSAGALVSFFGLLFGALLGGLVAGLFLALLGAVGPLFYVRFLASRRREAFRHQLPDVLQLLSGALRAGYSIQQAVAAVGEDSQPPAQDEFRRTMAEVRLGANLDDALQSLAKRMQIVDFDWTILAIQIQREVGGNLAEILEIISETIRERERLRRQIKSLTAEGRMSGWVLGLLPFAMVLLLQVRNPGYLTPLFTTTKGIVAVGASACLMAIGVLWMRKIIRIQV